MIGILDILLAMVMGYILGSVPFAFIIGKICKGIDIRQQGSGNIGATNALRVLGKPLGIVTLLLDMAKGWSSVYLARSFFQLTTEWALVLIGLSAVLGHMYTIFLRFKGGKGVATTFGIFLAYAPIPTLITMGIWLLIFFITGYASLGSIFSSISFPILIYFIQKNPVYTILGIVLGIFIIYRHKSNIQRLVEGTENKFSFSSRSK